MYSRVPVQDVGDEPQSVVREARGMGAERFFNAGDFNLEMWTLKEEGFVGFYGLVQWWENA